MRVREIPQETTYGYTADGKRVVLPPYWSYEVQLNVDEWPPLDSDYEWLDRPIRRWCQAEERKGFISFGANGHLLFESPEDFLMFKMIFGEKT